MQQLYNNSRQNHHLWTYTRRPSIKHPYLVSGIRVMGVFGRYPDYLRITRLLRILYKLLRRWTCITTGRKARGDGGCDKQWTLENTSRFIGHLSKITYTQNTYHTKENKSISTGNIWIFRGRWIATYWLDQLDEPMSHVWRTFVDNIWPTRIRFCSWKHNETFQDWNYLDRYEAEDMLIIVYYDNISHTIYWS